MREDTVNTKLPCLLQEPVPNILVSKLGEVKVMRDLMSGVPPENYQCSKCHNNNHWLENCPYYKVPPPGYTCKICRKPGHWVDECPTRVPPADYLCEICREPGHWKKDCPRVIRK